MRFDKEWLVEAMYGGGGVKRMSEEIVGKSRWLTEYEIIIQLKETGQYYKVNFSRGSTEYQDHGIEFDGEDDGWVDCPEVWRVPAIVYQWSEAPHDPEAFERTLQKYLRGDTKG